MEHAAHRGGPHLSAPQTGIDSPATHLHPMTTDQLSDHSPNDESDTACDYFKDISDFKLSHKNNFVFLHVNINSFRHKFAHVQEILSKHRVDYLAISESKLDDSFPDAQFTVQGYNIYRQDNTSTSGGLIIYVRSDIPQRRLLNAECNTDGIESLCIELTIGKTKTVFTCVYRSRKKFILLVSRTRNSCLCGAIG